MNGFGLTEAPYYILFTHHPPHPPTTLPQQTMVTTQNNNFHPGHLLLTFLGDLEMCTPMNANIDAILPIKSKIHTNFI